MGRLHDEEPARGRERRAEASTCRTSSRRASRARRSTATPLGLSLLTLEPGFRMPFGHKHEDQEEVYVIIRGSARIKVEDEIVELGPLDAIRFDTDTMRAVEAGPAGLEYLAFGAGDDPTDAEMVQDWWTRLSSTRRPRALRVGSLPHHDVRRQPARELGEALELELVDPPLPACPDRLRAPPHAARADGARRWLAQPGLRHELVDRRRAVARRRSSSSRRAGSPMASKASAFRHGSSRDICVSRHISIGCRSRGGAGRRNHEAINDTTKEER